MLERVFRFTMQVNREVAMRRLTIEIRTQFNYAVWDQTGLTLADLRSAVNHEYILKRSGTICVC